MDDATAAPKGDSAKVEAPRAIGTKPPEPDRPALGPVLRHYGPWLVGLWVVALGIWGYLDLRDRIDRLAESPPASASPAAPSSEATPAPAAAAPPSEPVVTRGVAPQWQCAGTLSQDHVRTTVGRSGPAVLRCIAARRAASPDLSGAVIVRLRVDASGRVADAHVRGVEDEPLVQCVGQAVLGWEFPPPADGSCAVVEVPFAVGAPPPAPPGSDGPG